MISRLLRSIAFLLAGVMVAGFAGATLVRIAPGFGIDERELDTRLNSSSIEAIRQSHAAERNVAIYYWNYLRALAHGDLGTARSYDRPVSELLRERIPVTAREIGEGLGLAWLAGIGLALPGTLRRRWGYELATVLASGILLCMPAAVMAILLVTSGGPASLAIAAAVFPKIFRFTRNLVTSAGEMPHVLAATARGLGTVRIVLHHMLPVFGPQLLAVLGVSVGVALGAAIPIEAICDVPGVGQLAWQAALARDLPLLTNLTLLVSALTLAANSCAEFFGATIGGAAA